MHKSWIQSRFQRSSQSTTPQAAARRRKRRDQAVPTVGQVERLEDRTLLTTLAIEPVNVDSFVGAGGILSIDNAAVAGFDQLTIENITLQNSTAESIKIDLSGLSFKRITIENVTCVNSANSGIQINLDNVTGLVGMWIDSSCFRRPIRDRDRHNFH